MRYKTITDKFSTIKKVRMSMRQMRMTDHIGKLPCRPPKTTETMEKKNTTTMESMDIMLILIIRHILQNKQVLALGKHVIRLQASTLDLTQNRSSKEYFRHH